MKRLALALLGFTRRGRLFYYGRSDRYPWGLRRFCLDLRRARKWPKDRLVRPSTGELMCWLAAIDPEVGPECGKVYRFPVDS